MAEGARYIADGPAELLHCSRGTVNRILTRARKPSLLVARRMEELMEESEKRITAVVPDEMETQFDYAVCDQV